MNLNDMSMFIYSMNPSDLKDSVGIAYKEGDIVCSQSPEGSTHIFDGCYWKIQHDGTQLKAYPVWLTESCLKLYEGRIPRPQPLATTHDKIVGDIKNLPEFLRQKRYN